GNRGRAPYKSVLTHGFVVDEQGRKMSKSVGNVIAPKEVIDKYGAEILRLWVSASDYRDDIRISDNILKQLSDAYRRIRNTCRFMLGNLYDFNPATDAVAYEALTDIDKYALHTLAGLVEKGIKAYENYEFHVIYHAMYNYCTVDLSAFYLDILKDRLYTSPAKSADRRSAQTVMYAILDAMVKLMAPILPFTAEEIWKYMPEHAGKAESIHMTGLPDAAAFLKNPELAAKWEKILDVRGEVTKALEEARIRKEIGHPLDAAVAISTEGEFADVLKCYEKELSAIFIVSKAGLSAGNLENAFASEIINGLQIQVKPAEGEKCERCWVHDTSVGTIAEHPGICTRCKANLNAM
ncbi:MAG: class I tRNA ligase family protein, partial [Desulfobacterales bacterium]